MHPPSLTACTSRATTAEPEALRTPNLQTQPRKPLHAVDACPRPLSLPADPLLPVPHHSNALPVSSCARVVRPGALTTDSWVLSHEAGGHQNPCFPRHWRQTTFPPDGELGEIQSRTEMTARLFRVFLSARNRPSLISEIGGEETINTHVGSAYTRKELRLVVLGRLGPESLTRGGWWGVER